MKDPSSTEKELELPEELNDLYLYCDRHLAELEQEFMELEKVYFHLSPRYSEIMEHLERLYQSLQQRKGIPLAKRVLNLQYVLSDLERKRGYDVESFHRIFQMLKLARKKASSEIIPRHLIPVAHGDGQTPLGKLTRELVQLKRSRYQMYLVTCADELCFLTAIEEKLWQKRVEAGPHLKIQIKSMPEPNIHRFTRIFRYTEPDEVPKRPQEAVLVRLPDGTTHGILADQVEGVLMILKKTIQRKTEYLYRGENKYEPYLVMKGRRYFLRNDLKEG